MIATTSQNGTLIRIWSVHSCKQLYTLRRGYSSAVINDISFSDDDRWLCCVGKTIHLFDLSKKPIMFFPHHSSCTINIDTMIKAVEFNKFLNIVTIDDKYLRYTINTDPIECINNKYISIFHDTDQTPPPNKGEIF